MIFEIRMEMGMAWCCSRLYTCARMGFDSPHLQTIPQIHKDYGAVIDYAGTKMLASVSADFSVIS